MNKRKICIVTGTRAEFGLLQWLMHEIINDDSLELQIISTGMHHSPEFGLTYKEIENFGFVINKKIEMLLSSDTEIGISKSIALGLISFSEAFLELKPEIIVLLGDRFEIFSAASAAMICKIPIAHIHGGESTEGLIDEPIRHSISKMSHLHFTTTKAYADRVIQMGESPERVFNVGAPGLDNLEKLQLLDKTKFEESIGFKLSKTNVLVTYHPVTLEQQTSESSFKQLLLALHELKNLNIIFTMPNADTDGRIIKQLIDNFVNENSKRSKSFISLGQLRYLSALKHVDLVLGNSSSGLIEVPSFKIPTINIGDRQRGRIKASSVINSKPKEEIINSLIKLLANLLKQNKKRKNPYGEPGASLKIKKIIKEFDLDNILKKKFFEK